MGSVNISELKTLVQSLAHLLFLFSSVIFCPIFE